MVCFVFKKGLVILENKLKPETTKIIHTLTRSNIRPIMCTGDNLLTGISVARECGMLSRPVGHNSSTDDEKEEKEEKAKTQKKKKRKKMVNWSGECDENVRIITIEANPADLNMQPRFVLADDQSDVELVDFDPESLLLNETTSLLKQHGKLAGGQIHMAINGSSFEIVRKYYPRIFEVLMKYGFGFFLYFFFLILVLN